MEENGPLVAGLQQWLYIKGIYVGNVWSFNGVPFQP